MMGNKEYKIIKNSGLFDEAYYLKTYEDVRKSDIDPIKHYIKHGWREGRNPSEQFDTNFYLENYRDVRDAGLNPLVHYIKYGSKEGRITHKENPIIVENKNSKIRRIYQLIKYIKDNPHLLKRAYYEIRLYGIKRTVLKAKNRFAKVENTITTLKNIRNFDDLIGLFNEEVVIPRFYTDKPIDIIIPIYNGFDFLESLLNSIVKNTSMDYRIIMCDDKSSDYRVLPLLREFKAQNPRVEIIILENEQNLGFVKTVNKLVKYVNNHFVLLNTDIEVPPFWIERLMYPIFKMKNIASTTPFTNAGTICSFPNYLKDNHIFENMSVEELDKYFQYVNFENTVIEIPSGVGFCMGINKDLVDKIGMFNEIFGKGYGEENDWCQRAIKEGYKNLHVTNLFVYHKHGGSFSSKEKQELITRNLTILNQIHPTYEKQVQALIEKNELQSLREFIQIKVKNERHDTVLIFDHGLGGGANYYIEDSLHKRIESSELIILVRYDFNISKGYIVNFLAQGLNFKYISKDLSSIIKVLSSFKIKEIFLNSLVSYPNVKSVIEEIVSLKKKCRAKVVLPIHDYFPVCPSYTLLNDQTRYCEVPDALEVCSNCLKNNTNEFRIFEKETDINSWRESWSKINNICDEIICFSNSSKEIYSKVYQDVTHKIVLKPHDISGRYTKIYTQNINQKQVVIGVLGAINIAKGAEVVRDLVKYIDEHNLNAKVVVIGEISIPINSNSFKVTGRYDRRNLPHIVKNLGITKFLVPSICPETFSYVTDEIIQMGYPLIVFDLGAPAERVRNYELGKVIKIDEINEVIFGS